MAEQSWFWSTSAQASGDQQSEYNQSDMASANDLLGGAGGSLGVVPGYLNGLSTISQGASVRIRPGGALVDGHLYKLDAASDIHIPAAAGGGNTRIDRIVLDINWGNFEVQASRVGGTDAGTPAAPSVEDTKGSRLQLKLAQALVDTSGSVTVTQETEWAVPQVDDDTVEIRAVDGAIRVGFSSIDTPQLANSAITQAKIANRAVDTPEIAASAILEEKINDGAVTTAKIANRTRTVFVSPAGVYNLSSSAVAGTVDSKGWWLMEDDHMAAFGHFSVPEDYDSGMTIKPLTRAGVAGQAVIRSEAFFGAIESGSRTHDETTGFSTINTAKETNRFEGELSPSTINKNDYVSLRFDRNGPDSSDTLNDPLFVVGWEVEYTADS